MNYPDIIGKVPNLMRLFEVSHDSSVFTIIEPPFAYTDDEITASEIEHISRQKRREPIITAKYFIFQMDRFS